MTLNVRGLIKNILPPILFRGLLNLRVAQLIHCYLPLLKNNSRLYMKHAGQRCFILGSGASIASQDLSLLKDEYVIALNNFARHPQFKAISESSVKEKYYLIAPIHPPQSELEWVSWLKAISSDVGRSWKMLIGISTYKRNAYVLNKENHFWEEEKVFWYLPAYEFQKDDDITRRVDISKPIWSAGAASVYALKMAIWMGFSEIYLIGMDHDYFLYDDESKMRFYSTAEHQKDELQRTFGGKFYIDEFKRQYDIFNQYHSIGQSFPSVVIRNASAGGILRVFPRVKYENLF